MSQNIMKLKLYGMVKECTDEPAHKKDTEFGCAQTISRLSSDRESVTFVFLQSMVEDGNITMFLSGHIPCSKYETQYREQQQLDGIK